MGGLLGNKALELFKQAMEDYGIEPGELYESIDQTLEVIHDLKPVVENIDDVSDDLNKDVQELQQQIEEFNNNSSDLVDALESNANSLEKFAEIVEDMDDMEDER